MCFEAAIIAQKPYGLSLNYSFSEVLPPNCTRIMFFIILQRYQDIFSAIWWVFRVWVRHFFLCVSLFLPICRQSLLTPAFGCSGWSWGWCWVWWTPACWHCCGTGGGCCHPGWQRADLAATGLLWAVLGSSACSWEPLTSLSLFLRIRFLSLFDHVFDFILLSLLNIFFP